MATINESLPEIIYGLLVREGPRTIEDLYQDLSKSIASLTREKIAKALGRLVCQGRAHAFLVTGLWRPETGVVPRISIWEDRILEYLRANPATLHELETSIKVGGGTDSIRVAYCVGLLEARGIIYFDSTDSVWRVVK